MSLDIFQYEFVKKKKRDDRFEQLYQFSFSAADLNSGTPVDYLINFYQCKKYLYIIDFFPKKWNNQADGSNKILSREENLRVNFRKIIKTCFMVYHKSISPLGENAAMVISGSLIEGEQNLAGLNISRKLKLYMDILEPIALSLSYRMIKIFHLNTIIFIKNNSNLSDQEIISEFTNFKNK